MKTSRLLLVSVILVFLIAIQSVSAVSTESYPANEPWIIEAVDTSTSNMGKYVSIAHDPFTGRAFISYYDASNLDLRMAYQVPAGSGNCGMNSAWQCVTIDEEGDVGKFSSIDVVYVQNPFPEPSYTQIGISYYDVTNNALKYASGYYFILLDWTIVTIEYGDRSSSYGQNSCIKFSSDHKPRIAYHYARTEIPEFGGVKNANYLGDGTGNCGDNNDWFCSLIDGKDSEPDYGTHISMDLNYLGYARIAYYDSIAGGLKFAYWVGFYNTTCSNQGWYCIMVDDYGNSGKFVSMHAPDSATDPYRFVYYESSEEEVRYARSKSDGGFDIFAVDNVGTITDTMGLSLTMDKQGEPVIAYMKKTYGGSDLMIARPASAYGLDTGNCGDVPPGSSLLYWQCDVIDPGSGITNTALFVDVSTNKSGLMSVAYYESDISGRLNIAEQHYTIHLPLILK